METIPNPFSFYDDDIQRWNKKFEKHIQQREIHKKHIAKTQNIHCLTKNTNIKIEDTNTGVTKKVENKSLFEKVLKRRKSRQSNVGPGILDFDYAGNSSEYHHLIEKRKDLGMPNS